MRTIFLLGFLMFAFFTIPAQNNFKPGYVITNQQDTLFGLINFRTDNINKMRCEFRTDEHAPSTKYLPGEIAGYRFIEQGKYYVSRTIQLNGISKDVFLEFLVQGMMNLYYYEDGDTKYFLFEDENGEMHAVSRKPDSVKGLTIAQDTQYKGYIRYLFQEQESIAKNADKVDFNQKSMIYVVQQYHNETCTTGEECIIFRNEKPDQQSIIARFSVYTGIQNSEYYFKLNRSSSGNFLKKKNISPLAGLQLTVLNPRWTEAFGIVVDFSVSQLSGSVEKGEIIESMYAKKEFKAIATSFRLGPKYTYTTYRLRPSVEAGMAYSILFPSTGEDYMGLKKRYFGYYVALGTDYMLRNTSALFLKLVWEEYPGEDKTQKYSYDKIKLPHIKLGYTF